MFSDKYVEWQSYSAADVIVTVVLMSVIFGDCQIL